MKINHRKTKIITFNPCRNVDFTPEIKLGNTEIEVVEEIKLLGLTIRSDLKWTTNTQNMILKANKRLWMLRRLKNLGAKEEDLLEVYVKQIRCLLELAVPAWQSGLTLAEKSDIERVQKTACHIILGDMYCSYNNALEVLNLETLESRRNKLCLKFALKSEKHEKFQSWFKKNTKNVNTRHPAMKYCNVKANHARFEKSPISYLTNLLNTHYQMK